MVIDPGMCSNRDLLHAAATEQRTCRTRVVGPASNTGHQVLAELEVQVVLNALAATTPEAELEAAERGARGGAGAEDAGGGGGGAAAQPEGLPPPMMPEGLENAVNRCVTRVGHGGGGHEFREVVRDLSR